MIVQFKKYTTKPAILCCIRDNGSKTWVQMYPGIEAHDLAHYAVETVLGFNNAFYGLVAKGSNIEDFELPRDKRPEAVIPDNLPDEALVTEHLVNLLMVKQQDPEAALDIVSTLEKILEEKKLEFPKALVVSKLKTVEEKFNELLKHWGDLEEGEILELDFKSS